MATAKNYLPDPGGVWCLVTMNMLPVKTEM